MSPSSRLGWLAVPAFLAALVLVGLGVSTEGRSEFERRTNQAGQEDQGRPIEQPGRIEGSDGRPSPSPDLGQGDQAVATDAVTGREGEITLATETGEIVIQTDENGQPILLTPVGPDGTGQPIEIDPDDLVAVRLGEDGQLEVVPLDEIGPDDTLLVPADGGFDLRRPDGSVVEFRADGRNDGITATEISPSGEAIELEPNPDGSVTLSDGTTVGPIDLVDDLGPVERLIERTRQLPWPLLAAAVVLLALGSIALALYLHRKRSDDAFDVGQLARPGVSDSRFEVFLDSLLREPDPSRAIRVGFSVAERGLGGIPSRRQDETPFEWHRRVGEPGQGVSETLGRICDLFARARFAPGGSTEDDRRAMVEALGRLHQLGRRSDQVDGADHPTTPLEPDRQDA